MGISLTLFRAFRGRNDAGSMAGSELVPVLWADEGAACGTEEVKRAFPLALPAAALGELTGVDRPPPSDSLRSFLAELGADCVTAVTTLCRGW